MKLENRSIWITGASSGIGEALAKKLAANNRLVLIARNKEKLEALKQSLAKSHQHVVYPMDVAAANVEDRTEQLLMAEGMPDVVFFNAGITQRALAREAAPEVFDKVMQVNFFGVIKPFQVLLKEHKPEKKLQVVVTNSVAGKFGYWLRSGYAASKHALTGFFDVVQLEEFRNNVRVTQVFPGRIDTPINENAIMEDGKPARGRYGDFKGSMQVDAVVRKILRATKKERHHLVIAKMEWVPFMAYRISKRLFFKIFSGLNPE